MYKARCYALCVSVSSPIATQLPIMLLPVVCLALASQLVSTQKEVSCYARETNPYLYFSTATAYEAVRPKEANPVIIPNCKPVQFWIISRHGTRYPDEEGITALWTLPDVRDKVVTNHEVKKTGGLCSEDVENLKKWTPQAVQTVAEELAIPQGYIDLYELAERFKIRFPTLLNQSYSPDKFEVRFTNKQRTTLSAMAFLDGLFGSTSNVRMPQPLKKDRIIRPYKDCKKWEKDVDENPDTFDEMNKFQKGSYFKSLIQNVSARLGFSDDLSIDDINAIYDACRFDKGWRITETSPWCAAFSTEDLQILEYRADLMYYYNTGYGTKLNKKMGCTPVKDFLDRFSDIEKGKAQPDGVLYFTHASMMQLLMNPLGIAKDAKDLKHSNFEEMRNRKWRTSIITPFATNLAAVLFKCEEGEDYRVQFYLGEHLIDLAGCENGLCNWSDIKDNFGSISDDCDLDDFC